MNAAFTEVLSPGGANPLSQWKVVGAQKNLQVIAAAQCWIFAAGPNTSIVLLNRRCCCDEPACRRRMTRLSRAMSMQALRL